MIEIKTWIRKLYCLVCDVISHPCHDFNGVFIINQSHINWVRKWMNNHTLLFNVHGIIHTCPKRDACLNRNPVYKTAPSPMSSLQKWFMCLWSIFCKYPLGLMIIGWFNGTHLHMPRQLCCHGLFKTVVKEIIIFQVQIRNIRRTFVGNKLVDLSDVVGASPVGAAPTTSSLST